MCQWNNSGIKAAYHSENLYACVGIGIPLRESVCLCRDWYTTQRICMPVWGSLYAAEQQSTYLQPLLDLGTTAVVGNASNSLYVNRE